MHTDIIYCLILFVDDKPPALIRRIRLCDSSSIVNWFQSRKFADYKHFGRFFFFFSIWIHHSCCCSNNTRFRCRDHHSNMWTKKIKWFFLSFLLIRLHIHNTHVASDGALCHKHYYKPMCPAANKICINIYGKHRIENETTGQQQQQQQKHLFSNKNLCKKKRKTKKNRMTKTLKEPVKCLIVHSRRCCWFFSLISVFYCHI